MNKTFLLFNHQNKGVPYRDSLLKNGWRMTSKDPDLVLVDREWTIINDGSPRKFLKRFLGNSRLIIYPHSVLPPWWYDGLVNIHPAVKAVIVVGEGQADALKKIDLGIHSVVSGWPYCAQKSFKAPKVVKRVLFAPIHPSGKLLRPEARKANESIMKDLVRLLSSKIIDQVIVRYIGDRETQGIASVNHPRIGWRKGVPNGSHEEIDISDLVIAEGFFMYLSVARGRPTIGINQHLPMTTNRDSGRYVPKNWKRYGEDMAYPISYGDKDLESLMGDALLEQSDWRSRFVGPPMDEVRFSSIMEDFARN